MITILKKVPFALALFFAITGCQYNVEEVAPQQAIHQISKGAVATENTLSYGESIVYLRNGSSMLSPVSIPAVSGTFSASPKGLVIDPVTGNINMSQSETGMWFTVTFTDAHQQAYTTRLMISGVDYQSKVTTVNSAGLLVPAYQADPNKPMPQGIFETPGHPEIAINPSTGVIDLDETMRRAALQHGDVIEFTVKYSLNDASLGGVNRMRLKIYRHKTLKDILQPVSFQAGLLNDAPIEEKGPTRPPAVIVVDASIL